MSTAQTEYSAPRSSSSRAYRGADSGATMTGMTDWMSRENTADAQVAELGTRLSPKSSATRGR